MRYGSRKITALLISDHGKEHRRAVCCRFLRVQKSLLAVKFFGAVAGGCCSVGLVVVVNIYNRSAEV